MSNTDHESFKKQAKKVQNQIISIDEEGVEEDEQLLIGNLEHYLREQGNDVEGLMSKMKFSDEDDKHI